MKSKKVKVTVIVIAVLLIAVITTATVLLGTYSESDHLVYSYLKSSGDVTVTQIKDGYFFDGPGEKNAIIFYPGAKVDTTAYAPLLYHIAESGQDCFLVEMPFHIALFGKNRATEIMESYNYENWYLSGHSLGGAVSAMYVAENPGKVKGLIFLAAYSTKELPSDLKILSIYGDKDGVLNREKYEEGKRYWNENTVEVCIEGGNHAQFGNYGKQNKDGEASISWEEQQGKVVEAVSKFME
ncbi:MAG: alpha/beta fold hydrolase [Clostridia bacterium]|nr:alpha/beta fold hydrolase [Clostridia bacterium]